MREDLVLPATARRLAREGLTWEPRIGDWCTVLDAAHVGERAAGVWLVVGQHPSAGFLALVDAAGRWPVTQVADHDCLWLPSAGQLKAWLRASGYSITTGEAPAHVLGATCRPTRDVCRAVRPGRGAPVDGEGLSEAEAVADVVLSTLAGQGADAPRAGR